MAQTLPPDGQLLEAFVERGDEAAFARIVERHGTMVASACDALLRDVDGGRAGLDDAVQAVFMALALKAAKLRGHPTLAGWLHRAARNVCIQARRDEALRRRREQEAARMRSTTTPPPQLSDVHEALDSLPERYRAPLILHHMEGHSEAQTAELLNCPAGTVSARLSRGRQLLAQRLGRGGAISALAVATCLATPAPAALGVSASTIAHAASLAAVGQAAAASTSLVLAKGAIHMLFMAKVKLAAMVTAAVMLVGGAGVTFHLAAQTGPKGGILPATQPVAAQPILDMPSLIKGRKVLMHFTHYPVLKNLVNKPTDEDRARGQKAIHDEIVTALGKAGAKLVHVCDADLAGHSLTYSSMLLLDCGDADPEKAIADMQYRGAGVVFVNGNYHAAIPVGVPPNRWMRQGQIPADYAFMAWGTGNLERYRQDMERLPKLKEVNFVYTPPPAGAGGGAGSATLTPAAGHTLLEVFILTGAGFQLVDPPATQPATNRLPPPLPLNEQAASKVAYDAVIAFLKERHPDKLRSVKVSRPMAMVRKQPVVWEVEYTADSGLVGIRLTVTVDGISGKPTVRVTGLGA